MQNKNKNLIILNFKELTVLIGHVFGQIKRYCCVSLGGRWIGSCPVQGCCNGCLGWRWTRTGILWINISFGLHAFLIFRFVMFFRWLNKLVVLLCGADTTLLHSLQITCSCLTSLALNPKQVQTMAVAPFRGTSSLRSPDATVFFSAFDMTCSHRLSN